jgi:DNA-binding NarL/FixJ family response regulator
MSSTPAKTFRILLIDDFAPWRERVRAGLQSRIEWQIVGEASDGPEGVRMAATLRPDLVLLDVGLPQLNGIEVARQIKTLSPQSKILFVSMEISPEIVQTAMESGGTGYLAKARATPQRLSTAIESVLGSNTFLDTGVSE